MALCSKHKASNPLSAVFAQTEGQNGGFADDWRQIFRQAGGKAWMKRRMRAVTCLANGWVGLR